MFNLRARCGVLLAALWISSCASYPVVDRDDGDRTPPSFSADPESGAVCDPIDPGRCLLPWPSNTFTALDPSTETGIRLNVDPVTINPRDDASSINNADGFSRVTPLATLFDSPLDAATLQGAVHLVLAQHDHPERGHEVPLRIGTVTEDDGLTLLLADPREVLEANADYVVIVTDALRYADQATPEAPRSVKVALELATPASEDEATLAGYHAPARSLIDEIGIDPARVLRVWEFTTRSEADPRRPLMHVRDASLAAVPDAEVVLDTIERPEDPNIAMIVTGRLSGLPTFLTEENHFVLGPDGLPEAQGTTDAPFRILVPAGSGEYRFVMYGHGTGGSEGDNAFDPQLAELGVAKVNVRLYGWTSDDAFITFAALQRMFAGSYGAAAALVEAVGHAAAIQAAMSGALADALSAETVAGEPNPAAGRRPDASNPIWVGGSLGGTTGLIYAAIDPDMRYAILNVPGAAWGQWVWDSWTFDLIHPLIENRYQDDVALALALAMAQTNLDLADGSAWVDVLADKPTAFLIQESMGDPVLPNPGTEMVAVTAGAKHVGGVLEPIVGVETTSSVIDGSGITQFRSPEMDELDVHGFANRDTPAGVAAREQILRFLESAWAGESIIEPPPSCPESCDFAN